VPHAHANIIGTVAEDAAWQAAREAGRVIFPTGGVRAVPIVAEPDDAYGVSFRALVAEGPPHRDCNGVVRERTSRDRGSRCCELFEPDNVLFRHDGLAVVWQYRAYSPGALMLGPADHRPALTVAELASVLGFARAHPDRVFWQSLPGAGATKEHAHVQGHRCAYLGGALPIMGVPARRLVSRPGLSVSSIQEYPLPALRLEGRDRLRLAESTVACTAVLDGPYNLIIPAHDSIIVVGRSQDESFPHKKFGAAEVAGLFVSIRAPMPAWTHGELASALASVGLAPEAQQAWEARVVQSLTRAGRAA
jgi:hypothetical protein